MDKNIYSSEVKWAVVKGKNEAILTLTERKAHKEILVKIDAEAMTKI
jgi:IS30 family transposase